MLEIKVHQDNQKTVSEILREENHYLPAVCAGRGTCGKCRVKIVQGEAAVTESDRSFFSQEELQEGWRLSCKCIPRGNLVIETETAEEAEFQVLGTFAENEDWECVQSAPEQNREVAAYILGIDIGSTTIAMALQNARDGQIAEEYLCLNRQRMYGADVVSRIQASVEGKGEKMQALIREDLWKGILKVTRNGAIVPKRVVIAANTTMIHLLMGYPCDGLGQYPFTPHHIGEISGRIAEILGRIPTDVSVMTDAQISDFEILQNIPVHILPGISTFVGADIVADMMVCEMAERDEVSMLIDIGTNGEMAIGNREKILVTSTAAGPAFEGGNISCGTGSIPGAICGVELVCVSKPGAEADDAEQFSCVSGNGKQLRLTTILNHPPVGICGTGTIEVIYELLRTEMMDETGYMDGEEFALATDACGRSIRFTQKDVRQLQLAKAAVRAGVETLLLRYGVTAEEIHTVYLAGGFGYHINLDKAMGIGLLPEAFKGKIKLIGNGSLQGALRYAKASTSGFAALRKLTEISEEIGLAADKDFNELYIEHMGF